MKTIKIIQKYKANWYIESDGHVMKDNITIGNVEEARKYLINYMSSYSAWTQLNYVVVPLESKDV